VADNSSVDFVNANLGALDGDLLSWCNCSFGNNSEVVGGGGAGQ
jgi:hypothetical protein